MMHINLAPVRRLGPVFDVDARGLMRVVPRRPWWPLLPVLVVGAPVIVATLVVRAICERLDPRISVAT
ncbi:MAG: hypothetical protein Q8O67_30495 [Deltaproteobacteria bacterium]|nr:hypothetical protein [Deltaproteobacteria bacterium]